MMLPHPQTHTAQADLIAAEIINGLCHCKSVDEIAADIARLLAQPIPRTPVS